MPASPALSLSAALLLVATTSPADVQQAAPHHQTPEPVSAEDSIRPPAGAAAPSDSLPEIVTGETGRRMDELVRRTVPFGFAGQVLVEVDGRVVLHRAYGYADPARRRPMTTRTALGVASVSKQFAAAAVLRLAEAGSLSLGDSLSTLFSSDLPAEKRGITIRQLLTHTSGVRSAHSEDFEPASRAALLRGILETPLAFEPGTDWRYSAAGYNLLAAIVERAAGAPYARSLRELLFDPARMERTGLMSETRWTEEGQARARVGWNDRGSPVEWPRNWRNFGAGDVVSTAADMWRWERALRAGRIFPPEILDRYLSPLFTREGLPTYGFGLFFHDPPDGPSVIEHGGDAALGYNASFYRYPEEDVLIIITCAARTPEGDYLRHALGEGLEEIARGREAELPPPASLPSAVERERLVGTYVVDGPGGSESVVAGDRDGTGTNRAGAGGGGAGGGPTEDPGEARLHVLTDGVHLWLAADGQAATDLLEGLGEEGRAARALANRRTRALLNGLRSGDSTAYRRALGEGGMPHLPDYWSEWQRLRESRGPLHRFRVAGSRPGRGDDVLTLARLEFRGGVGQMSYFWSEGAGGRLFGTFVHPDPYRPPSSLALAHESDGGLVAHALMDDRTLRVEVSEVAGSEPPGSGDREEDSPGGSRRVSALRLFPIGGGEPVRAVRVGPGGWVPPF